MITTLVIVIVVAIVALVRKIIIKIKNNKSDDNYKN